MRGREPIPVVEAWVKGHFTGKKRELKHDLNTQADNLATQHLKNLPPRFKPSKCPCNPPPPGYKVCLQHQSSIISSKYYHFISQLQHDTNLKTHILNKTNWTKTTFCKGGLVSS
jgi:hypothetical protein